MTRPRGNGSGAHQRELSLGMGRLSSGNIAAANNSRSLPHAAAQQRTRLPHRAQASTAKTSADNATSARTSRNTASEQKGETNQQQQLSLRGHTQSAGRGPLQGSLVVQQPTPTAAGRFAAKRAQRGVACAQEEAHTRGSAFARSAHLLFSSNRSSKCSTNPRVDCNVEQADRAMAASRRGYACNGPIAFLILSSQILLIGLRPVNSP